jgi:hypothetical protein
LSRQYGQPYQQQPTTDLHPEPDKFGSHRPLLMNLTLILILSSNLRLGRLSYFFPSGFPTRLSLPKRLLPSIGLNGLISQEIKLFKGADKGDMALRIIEGNIKIKKKF